MYWTDEKLVVWLQRHPGTRKPIISILIRRYKNLIYKELSRQCDPRYDRDDLSQQIILIFVQLLEEFDASKGVPLAGFLKAKLSNRVYNFFKSQVKIWTQEVANEVFNDSDDDDDSETSIKQTQRRQQNVYEMPSSHELDFWKDVCLYLPAQKFEALYWRYQANFCNAEIAIMLNLSVDDAGKIVDNACNALRFCPPFLKKYSPALLSSSVKKGNSKEKHLHTAKNSFHAIRKIIMDTCRITMKNIEAEQHQKTIDTITSIARQNKTIGMQGLIAQIIKLCNLEGNNPYASITIIREQN
jgi:DNA-directed RNA polymerase specialized sigma24 family protein